MTGSQLRNARITLQLSCEEMAKLMGTTLRSYYRWEAKKPPLTGARLLVTYLKNPQVLWADVAEVRGTDEH